MKAGILILASFCMLGSAYAQDSEHRTVTATSGQMIQLSVHFNVKADCTTAPAPEIKVIGSPKSGSLLLRSGTAKVARVRNCSDLSAPARVVTYRSKAGFVGQDAVKYTLVTAQGKTVTHEVTINVQAAPPPKPARERARDI